MKRRPNTGTARLLILSGIVLTVAAFSCKTHYKLADEHYTLVKGPNSLEHGKELTTNVCGGCHYNQQFGGLEGHQLHDLPKFMGKIYSANLTQSKRYGVPPHYTDAQLAYLIKTGIKNNGRFIPYMIRPTMADEDVNDIIVYLRSDDRAVQPGDTIAGRTHLSLIGKMANHTQHPQPYMTGIKRPTPNDAIANGRYLVDIIGCYHCHSKGVLSLKYTHPEQSKGYMAGGMKFKNLQGKKVHASNLTPCVSTGIGKYSQDDLRKALRDGVTPDARTLSFPMPKFKNLSDNQIDDIYAYLKSLPPMRHHVKGH